MREDGSHSCEAGQRRTYFQLQLAAHQTRVVADELFHRDGGITTAQAAALSLIAQRGGCSQRDLAGVLRQRESAITTMVRRLERAGLVERHVSVADARAWELWLTPAGLDTIARLDHARAQLNRMLETAIGRTGVDAFTDALQALTNLPQADSVDC